MSEQNRAESGFRPLQSAAEVAMQSLAEDRPTEGSAASAETNTSTQADTIEQQQRLFAGQATDKGAGLVGCGALYENTRAVVHTV